VDAGFDDLTESGHIGYSWWTGGPRGCPGLSYFDDSGAMLVIRG
jgi:hypothetical protein